MHKSLLTSPNGAMIVLREVSHIKLMSGKNIVFEGEFHLRWIREVSLIIFTAVLALLVGGINHVHQNLSSSISTTAYAATTDNQAEGTWGTCNWYLTQDGVLHIGSGKLAEPTTSNLNNGNGSQIGTVIADALSITGTDAQVSAAALVKQVVLDGSVQAPVNSSNLFAQLSNVTSFVNLQDLDTSQTTNMSYMFIQDASADGDVLNSLDVSHFNTSKVTNMISMFGKSNLVHIDLSNFETAKVTNMMSMFNGDKYLESIDLSSFDCSGLTDAMANFYMFYQNINLQKITLGPKMHFEEDPFLGESNTGSSAYPQPSSTNTGKWQAIGDGSDHNPLGAKFDKGADIVSLYNSDSRPTKVETYIWEPTTRETRVTAKYVDESGQQIADDLTTDYGVIGSTNPGYTTNQLAVDGYTFDKVTGTVSGAYPNKDATVTYTYKKNQSSSTTTGTTTGHSVAQAQPVTVHYVDEDGQAVAPAKTLTGDYGATYHASQPVITGYTLLKDSGNTTGTFTSTAQTVTYTYRRQKTTKLDTATTYPVVSSIKKIGLYRTPNFKPARRIHWYTKQPRTQWPMFVVTSVATSKQGHLRYHVRDVNHDSATFGKTGYITARSSYVVPTYYTKRATRVTVLAKHGIRGYQRTSLKGKSVHYRRNQHLRIKRIVTYHRTTRFQLTNGKYISGNKKLVKILK